MSFLKNLFKRKEGGTMVGNLIRGAAHSINPMLGNGAMMLKPTDALAVQPSGQLGTSQTPNVLQDSLNSIKGFFDGVKNIGNEGVKTSIKPETVLLIAGAVIGVFFIIKKMK